MAHYRCIAQRTVQHTDTVEIIVHAESEGDAEAIALQLLVDEAETSGDDIYDWTIGNDDLYDVNDISIDYVEYVDE